MAPWLRLHAPHAGGPGSIPGQGTRAYKQQLRVCMPKQTSKILPAATKTQLSQINIKRKKKNDANSGEYQGWPAEGPGWSPRLFHCAVFSLDDPHLPLWPLAPVLYPSAEPFVGWRNYHVPGSPGCRLTSTFHPVTQQPGGMMRVMI